MECLGLLCKTVLLPISQQHRGKLCYPDMLAEAQASSVGSRGSRFQPSAPALAQYSQPPQTEYLGRFLFIPERAAHRRCGPA